MPAWLRIARPDGNRWAIDERDATGEVIGTAYRALDGAKDSRRGGKRGLILPWPLPAYAGSSDRDPVWVAEGASDTAALLGLGIDAAGVPMAGACGPMLAELLADRHVVIVADADDAGRRGAAKLAAALRKRCASVRTIEPPGGAKDVRAAVIAGADHEAFEALADTAAEADPLDHRPDGAAIVVRLSDVAPEPVAWLWPGRFALGKLTLLAGDPGLGKSFLTLDTAARVSRGAPWPDRPEFANAAGGVVLLSAEDDIADTIRPRLDAAGADVDRISAIKAIKCGGPGRARENTRMFDLSRDLPALEEAIGAMPQCRLVIIDPITAYLGGEDSHKNADIRGLLAPLAELAARHGVAVIAVTHLNKNAGGPAIYRSMGSLAFAAAARAVWAVVKDKDDPALRLLLPIKNNIAPDMGGLAYRIEPVGVGGCPVVAWEPGSINITADEALSGLSRDGGSGGAVDEATEWLRDTLSGGPRPAKEVKAEAERDGIKPRTLDRAKRELKIKATREGYASEGRWVWALPHSAPPDPKSASSRELAHKDPAGALCRGGGDWEEP